MTACRTGNEKTDGTMRQGGKNRSRGRNGRNGHKPHMPMRNQTFDSGGPDMRVRGNAWQVHERYLNMARDAAAAGDRVAAENFFQHADHYYRMVNLNGDGRPQHQGQHPQTGQPIGQPQTQQGQPMPHGQMGYPARPQNAAQGPNDADPAEPARERLPPHQPGE
ncbi:MAG: DUF4167 domain-containing protein [Rhodospirillales bacterium]